MTVIEGACFVDTNIWLYALVDGQGKAPQAKQALQQCQPVISTQVINEVCINLIKKAAFDEAKIAEIIHSFYNKYEVIEIDKSILLTASQLRAKHQFSFWDSGIIACALASGSTILLSEDLHQGMLIEKQLKIINPFKLSS